MLFTRRKLLTTVPSAICVLVTLFLTGTDESIAQGVYDYDLRTYLSPEQEPNNTADQSTPLPVSYQTYGYGALSETLLGVYGMKGNISQGDEDWFVISMESTTVMELRNNQELEGDVCKPEIWAIQSITDTGTNLGLVYKGKAKPNYDFITLPAGNNYVKFDASCFGDYWFILQETKHSFLNYEMELFNDNFSYAQEIPLHYDPVLMQFKDDYFDESPVGRLSPNSPTWTGGSPPFMRDAVWVKRTSIHKYRNPNFQTNDGSFWNAAITGGSVTAQSDSNSDFDWFKVELINLEKKDFHLWFSVGDLRREDSSCKWQIQYYSPDQRLLIDSPETVSIEANERQTHESRTLESIKPGVLDSLDAVFVLVSPVKANYCDTPYRINFAAKKAKAEIPVDGYSTITRWEIGTQRYSVGHQNDLASGPLKLLLDETENRIWKEQSSLFFDENNVSASQVLKTPVSYFSEHKIWIKNLLYGNTEYDLSLLLSYDVNNELVLTVDYASASASKIDGIKPALEGVLLFVPYFRAGQTVYRMTLELVDSQALTFKLNEIVPRY